MGRAATLKDALTAARKAGYEPKKRQQIGPRWNTDTNPAEWAIEVKVPGQG